MTRWPSLKQVIAVWATLTAGAYCAYVFYMHSLPPDELVMASTLSFQAMIGLFVVGLPAIVFLLLFLFIGAIAKHWLVDSKTSSQKSLDVVDFVALWLREIVIAALLAFSLLTLLVGWLVALIRRSGARGKNAP
jgi:hypothetical protein